MRLFGLVLIAATLLSLAPFSAGSAAACKFIGPMPTPPVSGAQWGSDCNWHTLDGKVYPGFDGMEELLSQYYTQTEDGYWVPSGLAEVEAEHDKDLPLYIILPAAFLLPLVVLIIGALMRPRVGGH